MTDSAGEELPRLQARLERERRARRQAERIAEVSLRDAYVHQQELELLERVARAANESGDVGATLEQVLDILCAHTGWPAARARLVADGRLEAGGVERAVTGDPRVEALLERHSETLTAAVLDGAGPAWAPQLPASEVAGASASDASATGGLAVAFAIVAGEVVEGVVELLAPAAPPPEPRLLDALRQVGLQVGRVVERESARRQLQQAHAEQAELLAEFERSNQELEAFAYIASHDLQEPLRSITGFVELLRRRYEGRLDERADEYITFVVESAARMKSLIEDLLRYSRVGRAEMAPGPVDLAEVVEATRRVLAGALADTGGELVAGELPTVHGDARQLEQLLVNLVGNALKFRSERRPRVDVRAEREDGAWRISVQDNGIGIPPDQAASVFELFGRLRPNDEVTGTGIGLAIVQRIVERHNGKISVAPGRDGGSCFSFTLPDHDRSTT